MMAKYVCINKCWFECELYKPGQIVNFKKGVEPPRHFELLKGESTLDKLRAEAQEKNYYLEPGWGVDKLRELLGYELPHHVKITQARAAKAEKDKGE